MKNFDFDHFVIIVAIILIFGMLFLGIYDLAHTTFEIVPKTGKVITRRIDIYEEPVYEKIDGKSVLKEYKTEKNYYLICEVENDTADIKVNMADYYSYLEGYTINVNKIYAYKKGTNELKYITYEQRKD